MHGEIDDILHQRFGLAQFRAGQREVIEAILDRGAALAVFPTGGGKSLCYQLPALVFPGVTVVVSPLIALMKDQIDALTARNIAAARLDSSLSKGDAADVAARVKSGALKLLYVAPERFANERFREMLARTEISLFAVDEAHSISEWGHNFRPDYLKLAQAAQELRVKRVLALTATATPAVAASICERFRIPPEAAVVTGFYRANLELRMRAVSPDEKDRALVEELASAPAGPGIVYVTLQKTAERVAAVLTSSGTEARAYHAGLDPDTRASVQEWFMTTRAGLVVATIAFGMGIDKADVRKVFHYDLPKSLEGYSQEIGRAGRDDEHAVVELLACPDDAIVLESFACGDTPTRESLAALVDDVLARGDTFALDLGAVGLEHDLRPLVLRTALTHLELMGVLREGTPFYDTYLARPLVDLADIVAKFQGERATFIETLFARAKKGRVWYTLDLGADRDRAMRALDYLAEQGLVELTVKDVRHRYSRTGTNADVDALASRFLDHEQREIARVRDVLSLVTANECQTNRLVAHFGEKRATPCRHCGFCKSGRLELPEAKRARDPSSLVEEALLRRLAADHPRALGHPRQLARFLCGLSSPALTREKLTKEKMFGAMSAQHFHEVLRWVAWAGPPRCGEGSREGPSEDARIAAHVRRGT